MKLSSSDSSSLFFPDGSSFNATLSRGLQQGSPGGRRVRRDETGTPAPLPAAAVPDADVLKVFHNKVVQAKTGKQSSAYLKGYNTPSSVQLPGYFASMSDLALLRLGVDQSYSPEQLGALQRLSEQRLINDSQAFVSLFTKVMSGNGVKVTPMPQGYYLSMINKLSQGQCSGISHLLSLAAAEGKQHIFLGNVFQAVANPDAPESRLFFEKLADVQAYTKYRKLANDPSTTTLAPYTEIAPQLKDSPATKTLLINGDDHRVTAGVIVDANQNRTYYYSDPNIGLIEFSSYARFEEGLNKLFTGELSGAFTPAVPGGYFQHPKYILSVFNPTHIPEVSPDHVGVKFMYDAPLDGLDSAKIINASRLPLADDFRSQTSAPDAAAKADYDAVANGLKKLHDAKGMSQYHEAKTVLSAAQAFIENHPDAMQLTAMRALAQKLVNVINEAAAPTEYPYAFESMEGDRVGLAEAELGSPKKYHTEYAPYAAVNVVTSKNADPGRTKAVTKAVSAALEKIHQNDPQTANLLGTDVNVVIAKPGDHARTHIRLGPVPTLIVGDDFFAPPAAGNGTVADRVGRQAGDNLADAIAQKQAALIVGELGLHGYYTAKPKQFLTLLNNQDPYSSSDQALSQRAGRTPRDFISEAYTARVCDGKLDSAVKASLDSLISSAEGTRNGVPATSSPHVTTIDEAQVARLQQLDASRPPIRLGELNVSRVELYKMGATVDGNPIENPLPGDAEGRQLCNRLQVDLEHFKGYLKGTSNDVGDRVASLISEIGSHRGVEGAPLFSTSSSTAVPEPLQKLVHDTSEQHALLQRFEQSKQPLPSDFFAPQASDASGAKTSAGLGFQAFSTYQGLRSAIANFQSGKTTEGAITLGAVASDYVGMGVEAGMNKLAQKAISGAAPSIAGFKALTVGKLIGKIGGAAGTALSVPFEIHNAIDSFNKAAKSTGKDAQDHYVNGAFSVANAAVSLTLTAAFLMGSSAAGPAGLIIAGALMAAQAIYTAVRVVEDIEKYTPLSGQQKFVVGVKSFLGFEPGFDVIKPYLEAKYSKEYDEKNRARYEAFLQDGGKQYFERVIFGSAEVEAKKVPGKVKLTPTLWYSPITWPLSLIKINGQVPGVSVKGGNDHISGALTAWNDKPVNAVEGELGESKATLWDLGDGDDWVSGIEQKPNFFLLGGGKKGINGGNADDTVIFNADARQVLEQARQVGETEKDGFSPRQTSLNGGAGLNTLSFSGPLSTSYEEDGQRKTSEYKGHAIDFRSQTVSIKTQQSNKEGLKKIAHFQAFSNATTVEKGESFIRGNDENNRFTLNGHRDVLYTGKGANVVVVNGGAEIHGEGGFNTYIINRNNLGVTIDDPADNIVRLDYSAAQISGWHVSPQGDLSADLTGEPAERQKLVLKSAFSKGSGDVKARTTFITRDGVMMTITAAAQDGSAERIPKVTSMRVTTDTKPA